MRVVSKTMSAQKSAITAPSAIRSKVFPFSNTHAVISRTRSDFLTCCHQGQADHLQRPFLASRGQMDTQCGNRSGPDGRANQRHHKQRWWSSTRPSWRENSKLQNPARIVRDHYFEPKLFFTCLICHVSMFWVPTRRDDCGNRYCRSLVLGDYQAFSE